MKAWLSEREIAYTLRDLREDAAAADEFVRRGFLLPPVVIVDGVAIPGYQPERLEALLGEE